MNLLVETSLFKNISVLATPIQYLLKKPIMNIAMEYFQNKQTIAIIFLKRAIKNNNLNNFGIIMICCYILYHMV